MQWVLDMGMPSLLASKTVIAAELSTVKPLLGEKKDEKVEIYVYNWMDILSLPCTTE